MGKLISIVGNLGAGKTTLTRIISDKGSFSPHWETPEEHPFHKNIAENLHRWALANQMDFFLYRCQQEFTARQESQIAVMDGGFDQDFHVFTRHIHDQGYLTPDEYDVCVRFYHLARGLLPPPDLVIRLLVDHQILLHRRLLRSRKTIDTSFTSQELIDLENLLDKWLEDQCSSPVIPFPFQQDYHDRENEIDHLILQINQLLLVA